MENGKAEAEENRTAYDEFLTRLDKAMREKLGMGQTPAAADEPPDSKSESPSE